MANIPGLHSCNCFAARQAARFVSQLYERHLSSVSLTSSQFTIFAVLYHTPRITMSELGSAMVMDRTSLVRAIKPLSRDGFIESAPSGKASRKMCLSLSKKGRQKYLEAYPCWVAAQKEFESSVGAERAENLRNELMDITQL